jgi:hypothetical protein
MYLSVSLPAIADLASQDSGSRAMMLPVLIRKVAAVDDRNRARLDRSDPQVLIIMDKQSV